MREKAKKGAYLASPAYNQFLDDVLALVAIHRQRAIQSVQVAANQLYWTIGELILVRQKEHGWGKSIVEQLSQDLTLHLGNNVSWSPRNLWFMRQMVEEYMEECGVSQESLAQEISTLSNDYQVIETKNGSILKQPVSELKKSRSKKKSQKPNNQKTKPKKRLKKSTQSSLYNILEIKRLISEVPWGHNILILQKVKGLAARMHYLHATVANKYSRTVLLHQIKAQAHLAAFAETKLHNFDRTLPSNFAVQSQETLKSYYYLDFLDVKDPLSERHLETALVERIRRLLMELGYGFCFIANQYRITFGEKEYFIDLLFYHRILKCLIVVELKTVEFDAEFLGKLGLYIKLVDDQLKQPDDNPTIGILLLPIRDRAEVEYALHVATKPIGVAQYMYSKELPDDLKGKIPNLKEFNAILGEELKALKGKE